MKKAFAHVKSVGSYANSPEMVYELSVVIFDKPKNSPHVGDILVLDYDDDSLIIPQNIPTRCDSHPIIKALHNLIQNQNNQKTK